MIGAGLRLCLLRPRLRKLRRGLHPHSQSHSSHFGATEEGLLARLTGDVEALEVVEEVDISVILAEKAYKRSLTDRLFGM